MLDISVVIPSLNEEKTIEICIQKCFKIFEELNLNGEVIISDNGSTDNSKILSENLGAKVVLCNELGYGSALREGFKYATGKYILMADADNTYDFLELPLLWNKLDTSVDMVIGTRLKGKIEKGAMPFLHRYLGTPVLTFLLNILYGTKISDSQCGMRLIRKSSLDKICLKTTGMEFASELLVQFAKNNLKIIEVPISLLKSAKYRKPHLRPFRDGFRHLFYLLKNRFI